MWAWSDSSGGSTVEMIEGKAMMMRDDSHSVPPGSTGESGTDNQNNGPVLIGTMSRSQPVESDHDGDSTIDGPHDSCDSPYTPEGYMSRLDRLMVKPYMVIIPAMIIIMLTLMGTMMLHSQHLLESWYGWLSPAVHDGYPFITASLLIITIWLLGYQRSHAYRKACGHLGALLTVLMLTSVVLFTSVFTGLYHSGYGVQVPITIRYAPISMMDNDEHGDVWYAVGAREWKQSGKQDTGNGYITIQGNADISGGFTVLFNDAIDAYHADNGHMDIKDNTGSHGDGVCMVLIGDSIVANGYDVCEVQRSDVSYSLLHGLTVDRRTVPTK